MKTIFHLLICATLSSGCLSSFHLPGDHFRTSKQNRIKNQHPINLENDRPIDDVSLVDHGPLPGQLQPLGWKRSFFINFMMTGQTYNNFLLVCSSAGRGERKSLFYEKLTEAGKQGQILKKWSSIAAKSQNLLKERSQLYHLPDNFFQELLKTWFLSYPTWNQFQSTFLCTNTTNNIFVNPDGPATTAHDLQTYMRQNGLGLKFPVAFLDNHWRIVSQGVRITPQIKNTRALRYYYFDYYLDPDGEVVKNIPFIRVKIKDPTKQLLEENLEETWREIEKYMGCSDQIFPGLVKIDKKDYAKNIYQGSQTIKLRFIKWGTVNKLYTNLNIEVRGEY